MFNIYQLNIVRNERLNFREIITKDTFIKVSVNERRSQNNGFHNTHITSEYIHNPTASPHCRGHLPVGSHSFSPGLP